MGRPMLYAHEIRNFMLAEDVALAYRKNLDAENWAEWASLNPYYAKLLAHAQKLKGTDSSRNTN